MRHLQEDWREAHKEWGKFATIRFHRGGGPMADVETYMGARYFYIREFLLARGWRQLPGSEQWV